MKKQPQVIVSFLFIALVWATWLLATQPDTWAIVSSNWQVTLTMIFGSFIAGATSEGGGAIAFPVFTKVLSIAPYDAKVFSLAIQSVGMLAASLTIYMMRIQVLWRVIVWVSFGGVLGLYIGLLLAPAIPASIIRMLFTLLAVSLAITLASLDKSSKGYHLSMPELNGIERVILVSLGFVGGVISGLVGSGIDMLCFSVLVLLFRISETIATPTSVILMAVHSIAGIAMQLFVFEGVSTQVISYWLAAVPVVVIGAPMGAYFCSKLHFYQIRYVLIVLISLELISSLWLLNFDKELMIFSVLVFTLFLSAMVWMRKNKLYVR